jgi:hypothetical protein
MSDLRVSCPARACTPSAHLRALARKFARESGQLATTARSESADDAEAHAASFEIERYGLHGRSLGFSRRRTSAGRIQKQTLAEDAEPTGLYYAVEHFQDGTDHEWNHAAARIARGTAGFAESEPRAGQGDSELLGAAQVFLREQVRRPKSEPIGDERGRRAGKDEIRPSAGRRQIGLWGRCRRRGRERLFGERRGGNCAREKA